MRYGARSHIIYLLKLPTGVYKIGHTDNIRARIDQLSTAHTHRPEICCLWRVASFGDVEDDEVTTTRRIEATILETPQLASFNTRRMDDSANGGRELFNFTSPPIHIIDSIFRELHSKYGVNAHHVDLTQIEHECPVRRKVVPFVVRPRFTGTSLVEGLRPYQLITVRDVLSLFQSGERKCVVNYPTGLGKTVVANHIVKSLFDAGQIKSCLVLAHSCELVAQLKQSFVDPRVTCMTYQSYKGELASRHFDILVADECHNTSVQTNPTEEHPFTNCVRSKHFTYKLFLTATPKYLSVKDLDDDVVSMSNEEQYGKMFSVSLSQGIEEGYLCDYSYMVISTTDKNKALLRVLQKRDGRVVVYARTIEKLRSLEQLLRSNGIDAKALHGNMSKGDQRAVYEWFTDTTQGVKVVIVDHLLNEGMDCPCITGIIHYDITHSAIRMIQRNGRALRPYPTKGDAEIVFLCLEKDGDTSEELSLLTQLRVIDPSFDSRLEKAEKSLCVSGALTSVSLTSFSDEAGFTYNVSHYTADWRLARLDYVSAVKLLQEKGVKTKREYLELCQVDSRLPVDPSTAYRSHWVGWIAYLSIDTKGWLSAEQVKSKLEILYKSKLAFFLEANKDVLPPAEYIAEYCGVANVDQLLALKRRRKMG